MLFMSQGKKGRDVINITRGDTGVLDVGIVSSSGEEYTMLSTDTLILSVREYPSEDSELLIHISGAPGSGRIPISHDDTAELEPGYYSAEIQLVNDLGEYYTVWPNPVSNERVTADINRNNFCIMTEVVIP